MLRFVVMSWLGAVVQAAATNPAADGGSLGWEAPAGCPDQAQMAARIAEAGGPGGLVARGIVTRESAEVWRLDLDLEFADERDRRTLYGPDCETLAAGAQLLIAMRLDPASEVLPPTIPETDEGVAPTQVPAPEAIETPATAPKVAPVKGSSGGRSVVEVARQPVSRRRSRPVRAAVPTGWMMGGAVGIAMGTGPLVSAPMELAVGYAWPRLRLAARGRYFLPRRVDLDDGRRALVQLGTAGMEACGRPRVRAVEFPLCVQAALGASRSAGRGAQIRDRGGFWAEAGGDAGIGWSVTSRLALTARLGAAVVLAGTRYTLGDRRVSSPAPVVGRLVLGIEAHLGSKLSTGRRKP